MRAFLNIASLIVFLATTATFVSGQKLTCACEYGKKDGKDHCQPTTSCDDGCTAVCGPGGSCGSYCRRGPYEQHLTVTFEKKTGQQIASELSALTHQKIQFDAYRSYKGVK
jgi:hypothetical protein